MGTRTLAPLAQVGPFRMTARSSMTRRGARGHGTLKTCTVRIIIWFSAKGGVGHTHFSNMSVQNAHAYTHRCYGDKVLIKEDPEGPNLSALQQSNVKNSDAFRNNCKLFPVLSP